MRQVSRCSWPGGSVTRSFPLLNASGGQVIGSTARPNRFASGGTRSAVWSCTHGQWTSQEMPTPVPDGSRRVNSVHLSPSKSRPVKAWSMTVVPIGRGFANWKSSLRSRSSIGSRRSGVTSRNRFALNWRTHLSSGEVPAMRYGWGHAPYGAASVPIFFETRVMCMPAPVSRYSIVSLRVNGYPG